MTKFSHLAIAAGFAIALSLFMLFMTLTTEPASHDISQKAWNSCNAKPLDVDKASCQRKLIYDATNRR